LQIFFALLQNVKNNGWLRFGSQLLILVREPAVFLDYLFHSERLFFALLAGQEQQPYQ
jgi:hypothetical protein